MHPSRRWLVFSIPKKLNIPSAEPASGQSLSKDTIVIKHGEIDMYYGTAQANSLSWINGDVCYILMDINKNVSKDEMVAMAKDMID